MSLGFVRFVVVVVDVPCVLPCLCVASYKATKDQEGGLSKADKKDRLSKAAALCIFHFIDEDNSW